MLLKEYRIPLPLTVDEYEVGKLYTTCKTSLQQTGDGEGVECVRNEEYHGRDVFGDSDHTSGVYTRKVYYVAKRIPRLLRSLAPRGALELHEESWTSFPYTRTVVTNPGYMRENFYIEVNTVHLADRGDSENVHNLGEEDLRRREVVLIDIANDKVPATDYRKSEDPRRVKSAKASRGPLREDWMQRVRPVMTAYKLVRIRFLWRGFQSMVESYLADTERRMFTVFNRRIFAWMDRWFHMSMDDARNYEAEVNGKLQGKRLKGKVEDKVDL